MTPQLIMSFNVDVRGDSVGFSLLVSHGESEPVVLDFATGQRFDFQVFGPGGAPVWQWSSDRAFTQAMVADTLSPLEQTEWQAWWWPEARSGAYTAVARLLTIEHEVRLETEFELIDR